MKSVTFRTLVGALAGAITWALMEPFYPSISVGQKAAQWTLGFTLLLALLIGLAIGFANGWLRGSLKHGLKEGILGALFGMLVGSFGLRIGQALSQAYDPLLGTGANPMPVDMVGRTLFMVPFAICVGIGIGAAAFSLPRTIQGAIGGAFAGVIAGLSFDPISSALGVPMLALQGKTEGEVGSTGRAAFAVILGLTLGLFIALAERVVQTAWLRQSFGKNEGKEWVIDRPQVSIGKSELATVPIFGDPSLSPYHAVISKTPQGYVIQDTSQSPVGIGVNGQRVQQALLPPGSIIQMGSTVLQFLTKAVPKQNIYSASRQPVAPINPAAVAGNPNPGFASQGQPFPTVQPGGQPIGIVNPSSGQPFNPQAGQQATVSYPQQAPVSPSSQPTQAYASSPAIGFHLIALDGPLAAKSFPISSKLEIGREASGIQLTGDAHASRAHAQISINPQGQAVVQDLGSTNGTFVNGQRVQMVVLKTGDIIKIGSVNFRLEGLSI